MKKPEMMVMANGRPGVQFGEEEHRDFGHDPDHHGQSHHRRQIEFGSGQPKSDEHAGQGEQGSQDDRQDDGRS